MQNQTTNRRRSSIDIVHDILKLCDNGGVKKTTIMHGGNMSYYQLRRYLTVLTSQEVIARNDEGSYQITVKGQDTLRQVSAVSGVLGDLLGPVPEVEGIPLVRNGHREVETVAAN